jgi:hypothetical protein
VAASDHVSQAQSGKYQYHRQSDYDKTSYRVYKGEEEIGGLHISHRDPETGYEWDEDEGPVPHTASEMKFARGHSAAAMTTIGIAAQQALAEGSKLMPDRDLSEHSSKLVRGLQGRGLVTGSAPTGVTNSMTFMTPQLAHRDWRQGARLNTDEVSSGRQFIKDAIWAGKWHR